MEIQEIFDTKTEIISNKLVYTFTLRNCEITQLRLLKSITIPANYEYIKDLTEVFSEYEPIVKEKVKFSIIQSKSSIFQLLFSIFKKYYNPIKPMYVCHDEDDVQKCLSSKKDREKYQNVSDMI